MLIVLKYLPLQRSCEWDPIHHNEVYWVWNILGAQHYRCMMSEIRRVKDPVKCRAKANFMSDAAYAEMEAYWASPEFIQKFARFKAMRATVSDEDSQSSSCSATYAGGSISMSAHWEQMVNILSMFFHFTFKKIMNLNYLLIWRFIHLKRESSKEEGPWLV